MLSTVALHYKKMDGLAIKLKFGIYLNSNSYYCFLKLLSGVFAALYRYFT